MKYLQPCVVLLAATVPSMDLHASEPDIKTPAPAIYLADNLDEKDNLGWCIDTLGRGFSERVQAHSCKPQGGDVQFSFDEDTGLIRSVAFEDYCVENQPNAESVFALVPCDATRTAQRFSYKAETQEFSPVDQPELCLTVGSASRSAGPFMSRELLLADCSETDEKYKSWVIAE